MGSTIITTQRGTTADSHADLQRILLEYHAILDNASRGITFTRDRTFLHCNQRFSDMFGWSSSELVGQSLEMVFPAPQDFAELDRKLTPLLESGGRLDIELQMKKRDGGIFWCRLFGRATDLTDFGKGAIFIAEDITERKEAEQQAKNLLLEYQAILDNASLGITFTRKHSFRQCNARFSEMFGWPSTELIGKPTSILYPTPEDYARLNEAAKPILRTGQRLDMEVRMMRRDGSFFWCRVLAKAIDPHDYSKGTIYITEDITERKNVQEALLRARDELEQRVQERTAELALANARLQAEIQERKLAEQQIRYLAHHDALTGLPNRRLLEDRLEQAMEMARRHRSQVAIQYLDLDRFKPINDHLGHRIGDLLLQAVATRLRSLLRAVDTVSRVGGDEFVIVLPDIGSASAAGEAAQRVLTALAAPYQIEDHALSVTPSIGISLYPRDGDDAETLLHLADAAMYRAKKVGRANYQMYFPGMAE